MNDNEEYRSGVIFGGYDYMRPYPTKDNPLWYTYNNHNDYNEWGVLVTGIFIQEKYDKF
jgi:hypothetical protein